MGAWVSDIITFNDRNIYIFEDVSGKKYVLPEQIEAVLKLERDGYLLNIDRLREAAIYKSTVLLCKFPSQKEPLHLLDRRSAADFLLDIDGACYRVYLDNGRQKEIDLLLRLLEKKMR